jgi:hypothetical protein
MSYAGTALSEADIEFGKKLWEGLRGNPKFPVRGMFWLLEGNWHLYIASDKVAELGPRDAYRHMAEVIPLVPTDSSSSQQLRINLVSTKNPLYEAFRQLWVNTPPDHVEGRRLASTQIAGMYIEEAYFYGVR